MQSFIDKQLNTTFLRNLTIVKQDADVSVIDLFDLHHQWVNIQDMQCTDKHTL